MPGLPQACLLACRRAGRRLTRLVLVVSVLRQRMELWEECQGMGGATPYFGDSLASGARAQVCARDRSMRIVYRQPGSPFGLCSSHVSGVRMYVRRAGYVVSTSRYGIGQKAGSNCTPLGLHRVAVKAGGGWPIGTVFRDRVAVGSKLRGLPDAPIVHRILWLEGLEPGFNCGGGVDSFARYIYIHGVGDEAKLGRPASHGCIHMAANDLLPLYERLPIGTLVWISAR